MVSFSSNILAIFLLLVLSTRKSSLIESSIDGKQDNKGTGLVGLDYKENMVDLRKDNVDVEKELQENMKAKLRTHQEIKDFQKKPGINLIVILPDGFGRKVVPEILKKIIENMLSNSFHTYSNRTLPSQFVDFIMEVNDKKNDTIDIQNISVTFKMADETLKCLEKAKVDTNLWCLDEMRWNSNQQTIKETALTLVGRRRRTRETSSIIDMNDANWNRTLNNLIRNVASTGKKIQKGSIRIAITLVAPREFRRGDSELMLWYINDLVNEHVEGKLSIKYRVRTVMHGKRLRSLDMVILLNPLDEKEQNQQYYIKQFCLTELMPRLKEEYTQLNFKYLGILNAVGLDKDEELKDVYRVVLRVFKRDRGPNIRFRMIQKILRKIQANDYKKILFKSSHNQIDRVDPRKDYLILTFEIHRFGYEDTQEFIGYILNNTILPQLKKTYPNQRVETNIVHKEEKRGPCGVDQYEVFISVVEGKPGEIPPEILTDVLRKLAKEYTTLTVTCNILERDPGRRQFKHLKLCLNVKKTTEDCDNPRTTEGPKNIVSDGSVHEEIHRFEYEDMKTALIRYIMNNAILPQLKKTYPNQRVETNIVHKEEKRGPCGVDQYEVFISVVEGKPGEIPPEILTDVLRKLAKEYTTLTVTCNILERDPGRRQFEHLKLCLNVKKTTEDCDNPRTTEGPKNIVSDGSVHEEIHRFEYEDMKTALIRYIMNNAILPQLKKTYPNQRVETNIVHKEEKRGPCGVDQYEVFISVVEGKPGEIPPEILTDVLRKLAKEYTTLTVTCNILERDPGRRQFEHLKLCLNVKKTTEDCDNPRTTEGPKNIVSDVSVHEEIHRFEYEDMKTALIRYIMNNAILPQLKKTYPNQRVETNIVHKEEKRGPCGVDQYEVFISVVEGKPGEISPEILTDVLRKLAKEYTTLTVTCNILERDPGRRQFEHLKLCLNVKKTTEDCDNPRTTEGPKNTVYEEAPIPPGGRPPKIRPIVTPPGVQPPQEPNPKA